MSATKTMLHAVKKEKRVKPWTLARRRAFLKLSMAERRRILAEQADRAAGTYKPDADWMEMSSDAESAAR